MKNIIIAVHDGIDTHYTGVGTIAKNHIAQLSDFYINKYSDCRFYLASIKIENKLLNKVALGKSEGLVKKSGGKIFNLYNGKNGDSVNDTWGGSVENFISASSSLATIINSYFHNNEEVIVICHDAIFLYFQQIKHLIGAKLITYFIPHSSAENLKMVINEKKSTRFKLEESCYQLINNDNNSYVVATGKTFKKHLKNIYSIKEEKFIDFFNGLSINEYSDLFNHFTTIKDINKFIPKLEKSQKVIFSWGRSSKAKGFKELLLAWKVVKQDFKNHILIIQCPKQFDEINYFDELQNIAFEVKDTIIINDFNPKIWQSVLRYPQADVICIPSLADPNPHTPLEIQLFSKQMNFEILLSKVDGIQDNFTDDEVVFVENVSDNNEFSYKLRKAIQMDKSLNILKNNKINSKLLNDKYSDRFHLFMNKILKNTAENNG